MTQRTFSDFTETGQRRKERADPTLPPNRPPIECDCRVCRDDTITICVEEAHRILQIDYESE